ASVLTKFLPAPPGAPEAAALLAALEPALSKLFPLDLETYGVSSRDRLSARSGHPLYELAEQVAGIVGVRPPALFVHRSRSRGVCVEYIDESTVALLIPAPLAEQPTAELVFLLARLLVPH